MGCTMYNYRECTHQIARQASGLRTRTVHHSIGHWIELDLQSPIFARSVWRASEGKSGAIVKGEMGENAVSPESDRTMRQSSARSGLFGRTRAGRRKQRQREEQRTDGFSSVDRGISRCILREMMGKQSVKA
jgi:hypothetical protein